MLTKLKPMPTARQKKQKNVKNSPSKTRSDGVDSRSALIKSAQKKFGENGYQATSVHDIAKDAGVNVSLVSYHFGGKEGLFRECFAQAGLVRLEMAERILSTKPSSMDEVRVRLTMFIDEMLIDGIKNPEVLQILQRELTSEFEILGDVFRKTFLQTFELLSRFLAAAKDKGLLAPWTDPNLTSVQLIGSVMQTVRTDEIRSKIFKKTISDPSVRSMTRDYVVRMFLEGITHHTHK